MEWSDEQIGIGKQFNLAIERGQVDEVYRLCGAYPWLVVDHTWQKIAGCRPTWIKKPARSGDTAMIKALLDLGFDINALSGKERSTALVGAIDNNHYELARFLLENGADPNLSRPLISALNSRKSPQERMAFVKLLVENGCDVNRLYDLHGDPTKRFTALDWTKDPTIIEYLKANGAKAAEELLGSTDDKVSAPGDDIDEVVAYFQQNFGTVSERSVIEIVPTGHPVAVHVIEPDEDRKHLTLFTTGLSGKPMNNPPELSEFAFAELFIQLPGQWDYLSTDPHWHWPIEWLRRIAQYPHDNDTGLGGPLTIIANGEPPEPLGPDTRFTCMMLVAERSFKRSDGKTIQFYRAVPIYTDERELELREGAPALMRAFDRHDVPFIVDPNRPSVAL